MLDIAAIINAFSTIASAVDRIQERKKAKQETGRTAEAEEATKRLQSLEETDLEHERLIRELSTKMEDLGKAIETEMERNRTREARVERLVYAAIALGLASLGVGLAALLR